MHRAESQEGKNREYDDDDGGELMCSCIKKESDDETAGIDRNIAQQQHCDIEFSTSTSF